MRQIERGVVVDENLHVFVGGAVALVVELQAEQEAFLRLMWQEGFGGQGDGDHAAVGLVEDDIRQADPIEANVQAGGRARGWAGSIRNGKGLSVGE